MSIRKSLGVSPKTWAGFADHTDLETKHFILKKKKKESSRVIKYGI